MAEVAEVVAGTITVVADSAIAYAVRMAVHDTAECIGIVLCELPQLPSFVSHPTLHLSPSEHLSTLKLDGYVLPFYLDTAAHAIHQVPH